MVITSVRMDVAKQGGLRLLPYPGQAIHDLRTYVDGLEDYSDADVIVLPYAPIPDELDRELGALEELGGNVERIEAGTDGWKLLPTRRPNGDFYNHIYEKLSELLLPEDEDLPSEHFRRVADRCGQVLIPEGALDGCDSVAKHRYAFMRRVADALEAYVLNGSGGRIDAFFGQFGINHAQTGGINATFELVAADGKSLHKATCNTHLKQGDGTTPWAAARVYYQAFTFDGVLYVAVLYAGPHPDVDVSWALEWQ